MDGLVPVAAHHCTTGFNLLNLLNPTNLINLVLEARHDRSGLIRHAHS